MVDDTAKERGISIPLLLSILSVLLLITFARAHADNACIAGINAANVALSKVHSDAESARGKAMLALNSATSALNTAAAAMDVAVNTLASVDNSSEVKFDTELEEKINSAADALEDKHDNEMCQAIDALQKAVDAMWSTICAARNTAKTVLDTADDMFDTAMETIRNTGDNAAEKAARKDAEIAVRNAVANVRKTVKAINRK